MFKIATLVILFTSLTLYPMQKPAAGWGLNPLSSIGFTPETNKTINDATQAITATSANIKDALEKASENVGIAAETVTTEVCKTLDKNIKQLTKTADKLIEEGLTLKVDQALNDNIRIIAENGLQVSINPATIKTLCFSAAGLTLTSAGAALILYESLINSNQKTDETKTQETGWFNAIKSFAKNRYVMGTASIAAGLFLIAKSNTL